MESTGVYWKPVWNILAEQFEVLLVNAQHHKAVPVGDGPERQRVDRGLAAARIAAREFRAPATTRELRDLTRYRVSLVQEINRIANRIQKVLEDANIKFGIGSDRCFGCFGRAILEAMLAGEEDAARLAEMSKGLLRNKIPELQLALEGRYDRASSIFAPTALRAPALHGIENGVRSSKRSIGACALFG